MVGSCFRMTCDLETKYKPAIYNTVLAEFKVTIERSGEILEALAKFREWLLKNSSLVG